MPDIRDGNAYSINIPDSAQPCIVYPAGLFDRTNCPREAQPMAAPPHISPESRVLTLGSVKVDDGGKPVMATLVATVTELRGNTEPRDVHAFARGMAEGLVKNRPGAKLRGEPQARVVTLSGAHAARITFDVDHLSDQGLDHVVSYAAWSDAGDYNLTLMAPPAHAATIDALADRIASTLKIAHPARPRPPWFAGDVRNVAAGIAGAMMVLTIFWTIVARWRRRRAAPVLAK
jgi:hypothetical protein